MEWKSLVYFVFLLFLIIYLYLSERCIEQQYSEKCRKMRSRLDDTPSYWWMITFMVLSVFSFTGLGFCLYADI